MLPVPEGATTGSSAGFRLDRIVPTVVEIMGAMERGEITGMTPHGDIVRLEVRGPVSLLADVTPAAVAALDLAPAAPVWVSVKATEVKAYPA